MILNFKNGILIWIIIYICTCFKLQTSDQRYIYIYLVTNNLLWRKIHYPSLRSDAEYEYWFVNKYFICLLMSVSIKFIIRKFKQYFLLISELRLYQCPLNISIPKIISSWPLSDPCPIHYNPYSTILFNCVIKNTTLQLKHGPARNFFAYSYQI